MERHTRRCSVCLQRWQMAAHHFCRSVRANDAIWHAVYAISYCHCRGRSRPPQRILHAHDNHTNLPSTNERNDSALQFVLILYGTMAAKFDKCHDGIGRTGTYRMLAFTLSTCRCKYNGTRCFYSPWWTLLAMVVVLSIAAFANFARNQITIAFNNQCQAANNNIAPKQLWSADIVCIIENRQKSACHLKRCHHIKLTNNNEENTAIKLVTTKKVYLTPSTISHVIRQMSDYVKSLL